MLNVIASRVIDSAPIVARSLGALLRDNPERDLGESRPYVCAVPKNLAEFHKLHDLERQAFGSMAMPRDVADELFAMRPEMFSAVFDQDGNAVAYTSAFFLRPQYGEALIRGEISDVELQPHMMYRRDECHTGVIVYLGAVAVDPKCDPILKAMLLASLMRFRVEQMRSAAVERMTAIMTTVSREGERLARRMGAKKLNDRTNRKDGYDVFGCEFSPALLGGALRALEYFPFARSIQMNFNFPSRAAVN